MTPKVKVKVKSKSKKEEMGRGEMTGKLYPRKELDKMKKGFEDAMEAEWKSRPENQPKAKSMPKKK